MKINREDILNLLSIGRRIVGKTVYSKDNHELSYGDAIFDLKNKEVGIYLGTKPDHVDLESKDKIKKSKIDILVLLTMEINDSEINWRIRYTPSNLVNFLKSDSKDLEKDLKRFCNNQCIMDCSEDCYLWRWKNNTCEKG